MSFNSFTKNIILNIPRTRQPGNYFENNSYTNIYLKTRDGLRIGVALFSPHEVDSSTQFLILLHGVGCNRDDMSEIVRYINRRNVLLLIPDYRGFAESQDDFNMQGVNLDVMACFDFIFKEYGLRKINIISFSLGTAIASEYVRFASLENKKYMPDKLILISPFCTLKGVLNSFFLYKVFSFLIPHLKKVVEKELNYDTLSNLKSISKEKVFVFHGIYDKLIPLEDSLRIRDTYGCFFRAIRSDHIRILLNDELWKEINRILFA